MKAHALLLGFVLLGAIVLAPLFTPTVWSRSAGGTTRFDGVTGVALVGNASWGTKCQGSFHGSGFIGGGAVWTWLDNGSAIPNASFVGPCFTAGGSEIPVGANGINVSVFALALCGSLSPPTLCLTHPGSSTINTSFDPTKPFKISLKATATADACSISGFALNCKKVVQETTTFSMTYKP